MRALLLSLALLAGAPASASAALGQVEPVKVSQDESCLGATGRPGEISSPTTSGVRFFVATREGLKPGGRVQLADGQFRCEAVAGKPTGAGVIVGQSYTPTVEGETDERIVASLRDPGGAWGAPVTIPVEQGWSPDVVDASVSERGDVLISWRERKSTGRRSETFRFRTVRRAPGAAFGAPETIGTAADRNEHITGEIAATGEAFVLTTRVDGDKAPYTAPVSVSTATADTAFSAPTPIGTSSWLFAPVLAVGADGRAIVAIRSATGVVVIERPPGGAFGPAVTVGETSDPVGIGMAATVGADGRASIGWGNYSTGTIQFASRPTAGASWTRTQVNGGGTLFPKFYDPFFLVLFSDLFGFGPGGLIFNEPLGRLQLTGDGRSALAWFVGSALSPAPALATTPLAGGPVTLQDGGPTLDGAGLVFAATLGDGTPALAWTEGTSAKSGPRLHLAAEGVVEQPDPAAPRVLIGAPLERRLGSKEALRFPVSCSGPCEVEVALGDPSLELGATFTLKRAGRRVVKLDEAAILADRRARPIRLAVAYRAPGAKRVKVRTTSIRFARRGELPFAEVEHVRAVRRGGTIRVTWALKGNVHEPDEPLFVTATRTRARAEQPLALRSITLGKRRTFSVTLRAGAEAKFVTVRTVGFVIGKGRTVVPVR
ncbi:hypothetical protein C8N24_0475 [Solirubrobacter pauli]|uniref:Uncharacterized protein n=1 Tax=Solirubrobacter pauli TaxID=166793 RepID=A0A660L6H2_9ACTN|nr:hypothetical protein [Solirubrobacter pauli]RKQ90662.1 hypothetical protein C8N24_0475 [Solirubrobacter pauli]